MNILESQFSSIKVLKIDYGLNANEFSEISNLMQNLKTFACQLKFCGDETLTIHNPSLKNLIILWDYCFSLRVHVTDGFPNLKRLEIPKFVDYFPLKECVHHNIKTFKIGSYDRRNTFRIQFPKLQKLVILEYSESYFEPLFNFNSNLEEIEFGCRTRICDSGLKSILQLGRNLKSIEIGNGEKLSTKVFKKISLPNQLKLLKIYNYTKMSASTVSTLAKQVGLRSYITTEEKLIRSDESMEFC